MFPKKGFTRLAVVLDISKVAIGLALTTEAVHVG